MFILDVDAAVSAFYTVFALDTALFIALGVVIGISVGAIPGLAHTLPIALVLPFSFILPFHQTLGILIGTYKGGNFGGSITAISFGTPGVSGAAATVADGYALTKQGKGKKALDMGLYSSITGDVFSDIVLIFLVVPIGMFAPRFGPGELTVLYLLALSLVVIFTAKDPGRGIISAGIGFFLAIIGRDVIQGTVRFHFGITFLRAGFPLVAFLMGFFAVPEIIAQVYHIIKNPRAAVNGQVRAKEFEEKILKKKEERLKWKEFIGAWRGIGLGSLLGTALGALPGPGATLASYTAHSVTSQFTKDKNYGKGSLEGVAAAESANNATVGATFIPTLTFGVPGSSIAALLMAALIMEGVPIGPRVVVDHTETVYTLFLLLILANPFNLVAGRLLIPVYSRLTKLPPEILWPVIAIFLTVGVYAYVSRAFDITIMLISGLLGYFFRWYKITDAPLILAFLVAPLFEPNLRQAMILSRGDPRFFFSSEIMIVLWVILVLSMAFFIRGQRKAARKKE